MPLTVTEVRDAAGLASLRSQWEALTERNPETTLYQTWDWNDAWWKTFGRRKRLRVVVATEGQDVVGIAPLYVGRHLGTPLKRLAFMGTGVSDYLDVITDPGCAPDACGAMIEHIAAERGYDLADLQQVPPWSPLHGVCASDRVAGLHMRSMEVCPHLRLPDLWDTFASSLGKRLRSNVSYYERLLKRTFADAETYLATPEELNEAMDALFDLHARRWRSRKLPGVLRGQATQRFHRDISARLAALGRLRLHVTRVGGRIVATLYCFAYRLRYYYYLGGFDPEYSRFSLGTTLTAAAIRQAITEGCKDFDFLRGHEPYKYRWSPQERHNAQCLLPRNRGLRSTAMLRLNRIERFVERRVKAYVEGRGRAAKG